MANNVADLVTKDIWSLAELDTPDGWAFIRFRTPVLDSSQTAGYDRVLKIVWPYGRECPDGLPTSKQDEVLAQFEGRLCDALEVDHHAALTAVLTFDGARQWVFYTSDVIECGRRISAMPHMEDTQSN